MPTRCIKAHLFPKESNCGPCRQNSRMCSDNRSQGFEPKCYLLLVVISCINSLTSLRECGKREMVNPVSIKRIRRLNTLSDHRDIEGSKNMLFAF